MGVKCSGGRLFKFDCPGNLVWDDKIKRCEWKSSNCPADNGSGNNGGNNDGNNGGNNGGNDGGINKGSCVSSCKNMKDGDYQSCTRCDGFVKCSEGRLFEMDCAAGGLVWDDNVKRCEWESSTCPGNNAPTEAPVKSSTRAPVKPSTKAPVKPTTFTSPPSGSCVSSCAGMPDGDYQACYTCDGFIKCSNERLFYFECAQAGLVWDDNAKRCEWESSTCHVEPETTRRPAGDCVTSCAGMLDGDYQACDTCHGFVQCSSERLFYFECALGVWDDSTKSCEYLSSTCDVN